MIPVSCHAVLRWLERRHGLNIDAVHAEMRRAGRKRPFNERQVLRYLIKWHKVDVNKIRREIYTKEVAQLIDFGATRISVHNRSLLLQVENKIIVTVKRKCM